MAWIDISHYLEEPSNTSPRNQPPVKRRSPIHFGSARSRQVPPILCAACAQEGRSEVLMIFMTFDDRWMNISIEEPDDRNPGRILIRQERKKVRYALWRCPYGHKHGAQWQR